MFHNRVQFCGHYCWSFKMFHFIEPKFAKMVNSDFKNLPQMLVSLLATLACIWEWFICLNFRAFFMDYYVLQEKVLETWKKNKKRFPCFKVGFPLNASAMVKSFSYFVLRNQICQ